MKKLILIALMAAIPTLALAGPPPGKGLGQVTAFLNNGKTPHPKVVVKGNGETLVTGLGQITKLTAQDGF